MNKNNLPAEIQPNQEIQTTEAQDDLVTARTNLHDIIAVSQKAVEDLSQLADQSQSPRLYEALATMTKVLIDANRDLVDLQKKKKDILKQETGPTKIVNNLVMSSADVLKLIKGEDK